MTTEAPKLKVGDLHVAYSTIAEIVKEHEAQKIKVPSKAAYWLARILKRLEPEYVPAENARIALIKEFGEQDGDSLKVLPERLTEFHAKWAEVCNVESDIVPLKVKIDTLEGVEMTPQQMLLIEKFVEE